MKISNVISFWFSATGTTKKVAEHLGMNIAKHLNANFESISFNLPSSRTDKYAFTDTDIVVFGVPVYAGRVPNLLMPFIRDNIQGGGALAVPVCLFGNRNFDDALIELRNILTENNFQAISAGAFVGEHSFSKILGAGRPDENDMKMADELASITVCRVKQLESGHDVAIPVFVDGCEPIRPYYTPRDRYNNPINILKVKPKTNAEKCISCGLCARICPMGAISNTDFSNVEGTCIKCCACEKKCPAGAKYFDDEGYLYHKHELEEIYIERAECRIY